MGSTLNGSDLPVLEERSLEEISLATYLHPTFLGDDTVRDTWVKVASQPATIAAVRIDGPDRRRPGPDRAAGLIRHLFRNRRPFPSWEGLGGMAIWPVLA